MKRLTIIALYVFLLFTACKPAVNNKEIIEPYLNGKVHFEIVTMQEDHIRNDKPSCPINYIIWLTLKNTSDKDVYFYNPALISQKQLNKQYKDAYDWVGEGHFYNIYCPFPLTDEMLNWKKKLNANDTIATLLIKKILSKKDIQGFNESEKIWASYLYTNFYFLKKNEEIKIPLVMAALKAAKGHYRFFYYGKPSLVRSVWDPGIEIIGKRIDKIPDRFNGYDYWQGEIKSDTLELSFDAY